MPIYSFTCPQCGEIELRDRLAKRCPTCSSEIQRKFHMPAVHYRCSGFYSTDIKAEKHNLDYDGPRGPEDLAGEKPFRIFTGGSHGDKPKP